MIGGRAGGLDTKSLAVSSCPAGRDYFESTLHNLTKNPENKSLESFLVKMEALRTPHIQAQCVEAALAHVSAPSSRFIRCNSKGQVLSKQLDPCASQQYVKMIHHSFEVVATCLKEFVAGSPDEKVQNQWVETYFKLLTKESGLHVNVVSNSGAVGTGQLTTQYITDFMKFTYDDAVDYLKKSKPAYCRALADQFLNKERVSKIHDTCAKVAIEKGQPTLGLLIGFSHLKVFHERVSSTLRQFQDSLDLTEDERIQLEIELTSLAYNMGNGGLNYPLKKALLDFSPQKPVRNVRHLMTRVHEKIPSMKNLTTTRVVRGQRKQVRLYTPGRVNEMLHYLGRVEKRYASVQYAADVSSCRVR